MQPRVNRRAFLRTAVAALAAGTTLPLLQACGGREESPTPTAAGGTGATAEPTATAAVTPATQASPSPAATTATPTARGTIGGSLTVYSGRSESLIGPLMDQVQSALGIDVRVRYGDTAELAAAILEEGERSPADLFFAQDAGALGAVAREGRFIQLDADVLERVEPRFRSPDGLWVGISGRARTVVYNTDQLSEADIPASILDFPNVERWRDRLGWAPTNGSFQAFVTALRVLRGDDAARSWLEGLKALGTRRYENNTAIVKATIAGEIQAGFVNHYYLVREEAQAGQDLPAENYFYRNGDPGALINVAGVGILASGRNQEQAKALVDYLLSAEAQQYFAEQTFEYPLIEGVPASPKLIPLEEIQTPDIDLSDLDDLQGTLALLQEVGLL
ncbi:iron ABC transporter substrate-binding protein [Thermomicrobiaceae bacterium CFH 74404]|uniref:Iron ABC transporter substrate-binding protein n=1 Tax=Thermalbibacter longus TaxID=2951981 RepID=A0AA42B8Z3_9BACT|nr:iron ABC transporter substrate-binding protein [Thermalbibacter longus]MCM8747556.1 iron ABC transporter substrate-binding protein [Thermalbibacter longus]